MCLYKFATVVESLIMLNSFHHLTFISYARRFWSWLYSGLQVIRSDYIETVFTVLISSIVKWVACIVSI